MASTDVRTQNSLKALLMSNAFQVLHLSAWSFQFWIHVLIPILTRELIKVTDKIPFITYKEDLFFRLKFCFSSFIFITTH